MSNRPQPLGIHLPDWEDRIIQTDKGVVRLLPIAEPAKQLFGKDGAQAVADQLEAEPAAAQLALFPQPAAAPRLKTRPRRKATRVHVSDDDLVSRQEATTLDRVHAAMLLQSSGRANAQRALSRPSSNAAPSSSASPTASPPSTPKAPKNAP